jgi:metal-sulfur cluster biosynthetic enzyme
VKAIEQERYGVGRWRGGQVNVVLTFDPPWDKDCMSDEAKLTLYIF